MHYARVVYRTSPHVDLTDYQHYPPIVYRYAQTLQYTVGVQNVRGVELTAPYVSGVIDSTGCTGFTG